MHWRMFISIPGLYSLGVSRKPSSHVNQKCLQTLTNVYRHGHCQISPGEKSHSQLGSTVLDVGHVMTKIRSLLSSISWSRSEERPIEQV